MRNVDAGPDTPTENWPSGNRPTGLSNPETDRVNGQPAFASFPRDRAKARPWRIARAKDKTLMRFITRGSRVTINVGEWKRTDNRTGRRENRAWLEDVNKRIICLG